MITKFITADSALISSLRCGGKLHRLIAPCSKREIVEFCMEHPNERYEVFGGITNTLVLSGGVKEISIITDGLRGISLSDTVMSVSAGEKLSTVVKTATNYGLSGMESLMGIPGTVGGAVKGNAGCFGKQISDCVKAVEILNLYTGEVECLSREEIVFRYRYCSLRKEELILNVWFDLYKGQCERIQNEIKTVIKKRMEQPKQPSLGSVFKRYNNISAGWYIEQCGLKGYRQGGMMISEKHANFIVNDGGTPEDYLSVMLYAEKAVYEKFGIKLTREVKVVGEQNN